MYSKWQSDAVIFLNCIEPYIYEVHFSVGYNVLQCRIMGCQKQNTFLLYILHSDLYPENGSTFVTHSQSL